MLQGEGESKYWGIGYQYGYDYQTKKQYIRVVGAPWFNLSGLLWYTLLSQKMFLLVDDQYSLWSETEALFPIC